MGKENEKRERERERTMVKGSSKATLPPWSSFPPSLPSTFTNDDRNVLERGTIATLGIVDVSSYDTSRDEHPLHSLTYSMLLERERESRKIRREEICI